MDIISNVVRQLPGFQALTTNTSKDKSVNHAPDAKDKNYEFVGALLQHARERNDSLRFDDNVYAHIFTN